MPSKTQPPNPGAAGRGRRDVPEALRRGAAQRCPACGQGALYRAFLVVSEACPACGEALHHQRADDAPAYFTIVVVAHVAVGGLLSMERAFAPPTWLQLAVWLPIGVIASVWLLPRIKGVLIALQWALRMHGFGGTRDEPVPEPVAQDTAPPHRQPRPEHT